MKANIYSKNGTKNTCIFETNQNVIYNVYISNLLWHLHFVEELARYYIKILNWNVRNV